LRRAAAQLDHFSLREKLGLEQCSQNAPGATNSAKQGLIVSTGRGTRSDLASSYKNAVENRPVVGVVL
jgi:hypothetical protein